MDNYDCQSEQPAMRVEDSGDGEVGTPEPPGGWGDFELVDPDNDVVGGAVKIYLATSWKNERQPYYVNRLREAGHDVYDFRNPPGRTGFAWRQVESYPQPWHASRLINALFHPVAIAGFQSDHRAMVWADAIVMLLPCGKSAHLELGWACGAGRRAFVVMEKPDDAELMYREVYEHGGGAILTGIEPLLVALGRP